MDASLPADARVRDLISKMTVNEKVSVLCTCCGFGAYEIRGREVVPSRYVRDLYAKFPGCGLGSFFRADWYSGRNWKTGLTPDLLIAAHNALQRFAVEETRLGIPLTLTASQVLGETRIPSGLGCAAMFEPSLMRAATRMELEEYRTFTKVLYAGFPQATLALDPRKIRRLAVIGPNADKPENQIGDYSAPQRPGETITPRLAFEKMGRAYGFEVDYRLGCKIRSLNRTGFADAVAAAEKADAVVVCVGTSSVPDQALTQNEAGSAICSRIQTDTELDKGPQAVFVQDKPWKSDAFNPRTR